MLENNGKTDRAGYGTFKHKQSIKFYPSNQKILGEKARQDRSGTFKHLVGLSTENK